MSEMSEEEVQAIRATIREAWDAVAKMIEPILEEMKPAVLLQAEIDNVLMIEKFGPAPAIVALEAAEQ